MEVGGRAIAGGMLLGNPSVPVSNVAWKAPTPLLIRPIVNILFKVKKNV